MRLDFGLLFLRLSSAGMLVLLHGWGKLAHFSSMSATFPDPLGMGSSFTLIVAVFAEFFCGLLVLLGLSTRLATLPIIGTLMTAILVVHAGDPLSKKEFAFMYVVPFIALFFTGPGAFSLDGILKGKRAFRP